MTAYAYLTTAIERTRLGVDDDPDYADKVNAIVAAGMTLAGIARGLGVHRATVDSWRSGRHQPHGATAERLDDLHQRLIGWDKTNP